MNEFKDPRKIWEKYQAGLNYKQSIALFDTVEENEEFFVGRQWGDLEYTTPTVDKTTVNFLQRVVSYFVSNITTDSIGVRCRFFNMPKEQAKGYEDAIKAQLDQVIEDNDLNGSSKDIVRDSAVDGDACYHIYFDIDAPSGQAAEGLVKIEQIPNTDVIFGNVQQTDTEKQPYIIIASRKTLDEMKALAKKFGAKADEIQPDSGEYENYLQSKDSADRVTMLTAYFRKGGSIHRVISTESTIIDRERDMGYRLYPVAWMPWEKQRGSYHGVSCVTALIPNQIAINKSYSMALRQQSLGAYPKILYDKAMFPDGWSNRIGAAIAVNGDPRGVAMNLTPSADVPNSIFTMINNLMSHSREMMGASDASLGNVNPDNTSAIIAVQNATAMPLEMKKRAYQQMIEKVVRSMLDIISVSYGEREILITDELGNERIELFDWGSLKDVLLKLSVDIGDANYWDPNTQATMLERLLQAQVITDPVMFVDHMPDGLLKDKDRLLAELKEARQNAMQQMPGGDAALAAGAAAGGLPLPEMPTGI